MERAFNAREGATRKDDVLPRRLMTERQNNRPPEDVAINSMEVMDPMLDSYYTLQGWEVTTGRPTRPVLEGYGLNSWADELEQLGLLGNGSK
jgi:aldehyde:ferredoxin oxidoreductase